MPLIHLLFPFWPTACPLFFLVDPIISGAILNVNNNIDISHLFCYGIYGGVIMTKQQKNMLTLLRRLRAYAAEDNRRADYVFYATLCNRFERTYKVGGNRAKG